MRSKLAAAALLPLLCLALQGCGGQSDASQQTEAAAPAAPAGLSAFEVENGVGPVKAKLTIGPVDEALAAKGKTIFEAKCGACHKLDQRYVGPALGEVLHRRTPEYVMNMALNSQEMTQKHPEAKKLLAEFLVQMPFQNVTQDDVRAIVEYLRHETK